jgi:BolA protein
MSIQETIEKKLAEQLDPAHLEVVNESSQHNVPPNSETHFKVVIVSPRFEGTRKVARHQLVYGVVGEELAGPVHALALHTYTATEWTERHGEAPMSPPCLGGDKGGSKTEQSPG